MANGLQRKKDLKKPDRFSVALNHGFETLSKNPKPIIALAVLVVGSLLIAGGYLKWRDLQRTKAASALFAAEKNFKTEWEKFSPPPKPEEKLEDKKDSKDPKKASQDEDRPDQTYSKINVDEVFPETLKSYEAVIKSYPKSSAAFRAALDAGKLYYRHQNWEQSKAWHEKALGMAGQTTERAIAMLGLGLSFENLGQLDSALEKYGRATDLGVTSLRGELFLATARVYSLKNEFDKAKETYERIEKELPGSYYAQRASTLKKAQL